MKDSARIVALFVLLGLLVLTALAVLGANIGIFGQAVQASNFAKWGITGVLAEVISLCWFLIKVLFKENKLTLLIHLPQELAALEIKMIEWDENECFIKGVKLKEKIKLVPTPIGPSLRVHFPQQVLDLLKDEEYLELKLKDTKGHRWEVKPFYLFENVQTLVPVGPVGNFVETYQSNYE